MSVRLETEEEMALDADEESVSIEKVVFWQWRSENDRHKLFKIITGGQKKE